MTKGVLNPTYELCAQVAREMHNDTKTNISRLLREVKIIKPDLPGIKRMGFNGGFEGYTPDEVVLCWRWLRTREEFPINDARLTTTLLGSPCYLQKFDLWIMDNLPPVYESASHDAFVMEHAKILKSLGFIYRCENQSGRLSSEQLIQCGLKETNGIGE